MKTAYFYLDTHIIMDGQEYYKVIKSAADTLFLANEKAKQYAEKTGLRLAGGCFVSSCKPFDFKTHYTIINLPKHFKAKKHQEDMIDRLIAYENGQMDSKQTKAFFKELKDTGIGKKLQGHYSSRMG